MAVTSGAEPWQPLPLRTMLLTATAFWIYASFTRTTQWELIRQALPRMAIPGPDVMILECSLLFPVLVALTLVSRRVGYEPYRWPAKLLAHFALAFVFGMCSRPALVIARAVVSHWTLAESIARTNGTDPWVAAKLYGSGLVDDGMQYLVLQALLAGVVAYRRYRVEQNLRERLTLEYARARLHSLRMQINPHFLYNTLSAIAGFVRTNPAAAEDMVTRLGDLFRRTLAERNAEFVPLKQEIEHGEQYLEIQRIRFEDRLQYFVRLDSSLESIAIPPLLLQPLLENAVEHGLRRADGAVSVQVTCESEGGNAVLTVRNATEGSLTTAAPRPSRGFGLQNVRERLEAAFGTAGVVTTLQRTATEFEARMSFPARRLVEGL